MASVELSTLNDNDSVLCANCGEFVSSLLETGWCVSCSESVQQHRCVRCKITFRSKTVRPYCTQCRELNWLEKNADEIEEEMLNGTSFSDAKDIVRSNTKPICLGCGTLLSRPALFCSARKCRTLYRRFLRLKNKGLTQEEAIREIIK